MTSLIESAWFSGPVQDAVAKVSEKNCVFLVYIYDDSEKSTTLNRTLNQDNVIHIIKEDTVGLAMKKDSENATMFGQFYPIQAVPILYFIKQGTIRDFGVETITGQEIIDKITQLNDPIIQQPSPVENVQIAETSQPPPNDITEEEKAAKKAEMQKQLEKVRKERAEREQKEAKEREIKRREEAKLMQEARQYQETRENKIYFDKIKKERKEQEEHRKRVREQIARDRAEKIAQRNAEKQRRDSSTYSSSLQASAGSSQKSYDSSNLNIKQLNGSNIRHQFEGSSTLSAVREWIKENRTEENKAPYKLSSQFPTRVFTEADDSLTLKDLNLCPSATIIMKPMKSAQATSNQPGLVGSVYNTLYAFIVGLFVMFNNFLTALFPTNGIANFDPQQQQQQRKPDFKSLGGGQRLGGEGLHSSSSGSSSNNSSNNIQRRNPYATRVNTIHDDDDNEDDQDKKRPTYNGNSVNHE